MLISQLVQYMRLEMDHALRFILMAAVVIAVVSYISLAHAGVVVMGTRVIYPSDEREVSVKLSNQGKSPALVKVWIDNGDEREIPENISAPFTLTPPIFRLDPQNGQTLRLSYVEGEGLAGDKESMFWLNVLEVPPKPKADRGANYIHLAYRTRIKLFFRPANLKGEAAEAPANIVWTVKLDGGDKGYALKAENPSPYFVNFRDIALLSNGRTYEAKSGFIAPGESKLFYFKDMAEIHSDNAEVIYTSINDWGAGAQGRQLIRINHP
ncbi:fimbria/pilus periplasmic chaperone [Burkholderia sp. JSH-S8]|nr:fimbria/pilus periplasmic chaperone [Burkholderia sp. JSH-S8]